MRGVRHRESGRLLAVRCRVAGTFWARFRGWVAHDPEWEEGLWLRPCAWVHTWGLRASIDVIFCDADGMVRTVVHALPPCGTAWAPGAAQVLELPPGAAAQVIPGDHLDPA